MIIGTAALIRRAELRFFTGISLKTLGELTNEIGLREEARLKTGSQKSGLLSFLPPAGEPVANAEAG